MTYDSFDNRPRRTYDGDGSSSRRTERFQPENFSERAYGYPASSDRSSSGRVGTRGSSRPATQSARPARTNARPSANQAYQRPRPAVENIDASEAYSPYRDRDRYRRVEPQPKKPGRRIAGFLASVVVIGAIVGGVYLYMQSLPVSVTLNDSSIEVGGDKTLADLMRASGVKPNPGDFVAVDGSVLEAGKGEPFHAVINGEQTMDEKAKLKNGDVVELGDGNSIEEESDYTDKPIPFEYEYKGNGPIHLVEGTGEDGIERTKTGKQSGKTVTEVEKEPSNIVRRNVAPNVGKDKVVALTFDDGPWPDSTKEILDVLAANGAKATFFNVGNCIENYPDLTKRAFDEGHQISSHSYDHAEGSGQGVNLGYMTPEERVAEVTKGLDAIKAATGAEASKAFRTPGGNYDEDVMKDIAPLITSEIGWDIDTEDWQRPGADAIAAQIESAWPGAIILMHDGGGDRSQTVEALKQALPKLKEQGYKFVTIDELMQYELEEE